MSIQSLPILNSAYAAGYANPFAARVSASVPSIFSVPYIPVIPAAMPAAIFKIPTIIIPKFNFPSWSGVKNTVKTYARKAKHYYDNNIRPSVANIVNTAKKYLGFGYKTFTPGGKYEYWCADFVSYVARENGAKGFHFSSVQGLLDWGNKNGRFSKTPKVGDAIIFKGWDPKRKKYASHTGIVTGVSNGRVYTIEGNTGGKGINNTVNERSYALNDSKITGYVNIA
ncbi:CHAP domain-containing protein [bacterium]|nr:CHAP domain-containing protein [bacterium]